MITPVRQTKTIYLNGMPYRIAVIDGMVQVEVARDTYIPAPSFPDLLYSRNQHAELAEWEKVIDSVTKDMQTEKWV